jgi:predicted transcriptional regulator
VVPDRINPACELAPSGSGEKECKTLKLTQEKLAELAGLHIRSLQKIEAGEINLLLTTVLRIKRALRCPWVKLLG